MTKQILTIIVQGTSGNITLSNPVNIPQQTITLLRARVQYQIASGTDGETAADINNVLRDQIILFSTPYIGANTTQSNTETGIVIADGISFTAPYNFYGSKGLIIPLQNSVITDIEYNDLEIDLSSDLPISFPYQLMSLNNSTDGGAFDDATGVTTTALHGFVSLLLQFSYEM